MVNGPPKVMHFAVDSDEHLVQMPTPLARFHPGDPLFSDLGRKHWTEPMPPIPHGFMTDINATFMQQILDIAK